jgi:hypothetical protein
LPRVSPVRSIDAARSSLAKLSSYRPASRVYPYSIIPGGIASARELRDAVAKDPVAAAHYAGFDFAKARMIRTNSERAVYVSYRRGENTYWTTQKLKLNAGEALITDGRRTVRTRCGNFISDIPASPVFVGEPTPSVLDTPLEFDPTVPGIATEFVPRDTVESANADRRVFFPVFPLFAADPPADSLPPSAPPTPVPEPATVILLAIALGGVGFLRKRSNLFRP